MSYKLEWIIYIISESIYLYCNNVLKPFINLLNELVSNVSLFQNGLINLIIYIYIIVKATHKYKDIWVAKEIVCDTIKYLLKHL